MNGHVIRNLRTRLYTKEKMGGGRIRRWRISTANLPMQFYLFGRRFDPRKLHAMYHIILFFFIEGRPVTIYLISVMLTLLKIISSSKLQKSNDNRPKSMLALNN